MADENRVTVTDNCCGHAVEAKHLTDKDVSHLRYRVGVFDGDKLGIFGKSINHHQYPITTLGRGKAFNEIHSNIDPNLRWDGKWLEQPLRLNGFIISALTDITGRDKMLYYLF